MRERKIKCVYVCMYVEQMCVISYVLLAGSDHQFLILSRLRVCFVLAADVDCSVTDISYRHTERE